MKKVLIILSLFLIIISTEKLSATTGTLKSASIIECDGVLYGTHGSDNHYHVAEVTEDGKYKAVGDTLGTDWTCKGILKNPSDDKVLEKVTATFDSCVDGDTANFIIDDEKVKFRFLAIDTPETVHPTKDVEAYGKNASEYTCNKLTNAKKIEIEYEESKTDKYGRSLGWIWVDDSLLQDELVNAGYAEVAYIYGTYKYTTKLCETQASAIQNSNGMWSDISKEEGYCSTLRTIERNNNNQNTTTTNEEENERFPYESIAAVAIIAVGIIIKIFK